MSKKSYFGRNLLEEIACAIDLLVEGAGRCTPTDVLRLIKVCESDELRQIVIDVAIHQEYSVKSSGKGYKIEVNNV